MQAAFNIIKIIFRRVGHRFAYQTAGSKMNNRIDFKLLHNVLGKAHIMDIALYQLYLVRHCRLMAGRKIIINNRSKAALLQLLHYMGANITCSAGNKDIH